MHKSLLEIHEDVPAAHYDEGIKSNLFQRYWHSKRFEQVLKHIRKVDGPVLDVGCHAGLFTQKITEKLNSAHVYGIDVSPQAISLAQKRLPGGKFRVADGHNLPFKSGFFSAVFCLEMLEHVDDPVKVITEIKRVLKSGGYGLILVPSDNRLFKTVWFLWTLYYPVWRHAHVQSFQASSLEKLLKSLHLTVIKSTSFNLGMLKIVVFKKP